MTTIVGIQGDGFAVICGDSRISLFDDAGSASMSITVAARHSKLCVNGRYVIGVAGDMRAINIVQYAFSPPQPPPDMSGSKLDAFITTEFIQSLRDCFEEQGYSLGADKEGRTQPIQHSSQLIAAINSTIYQIDTDYAWCSDSRGVYGAGTGASYALGAVQAQMVSSLTIGKAKRIAGKALEIASLYDPYTGPPYCTAVQDGYGTTISTSEKTIRNGNN